MSLTAQQNALIQTKLNRPRITSELIERPRLYTTLSRRRPLTVVVAPAGYGKTTLVGSWCEQSGMVSTWLTLDPNNSHLNSFLSYLLAALERLFPGFAHETGLGPNFTGAISVAAVARTLADALDEIETPFLLVLDDYHHVTDPAIHRLLSELLRYPPHSLNLVIASRVDPPLPLAALRSRDQLTEVRTFDLRFTRNETADYLKHELEQTLDAPTLTLLDESIEGWIAGLHLAVLYLRNEEDIAAAARQFAQDDRFTVDYLATEVLGKQEADVRSFLIKTSILARMCPELCDAVLGVAPSTQHSRRILNQLHSADVFMSALDRQGEWYRYHQLFQHFLKHHLQILHTAAEIAALYTAAGDWCAAQGFYDEAIPYMLACGQVDKAVRLVEIQRHIAMDGEKWGQLEHWLGLFPRRIIDSVPQLIILEAWLLRKRERLAEIPERLELAEGLLASASLSDELKKGLRGEIDTLRSQQLFWSGDAALTFTIARRALDHTPLEWASVRGIAWLFAAGAVFLTQGKRQALDFLQTAATEDPLQRTLVSARALLCRGFVYWMSADMVGLKQTGEELLHLARRRNWQESVAFGHYLCGCANYQQNNLAAAAADFTAIMERRHSAPGFAFVQGAFGLAAVLQAQGKSNEAHAAVEALLEYTLEIGDRARRGEVQAFDAYLALKQNDFERALRWLVGANRSLYLIPIPTFYAPILTVAAALIRSGDAASLAEAEQLLRNLAAFLAASHIDLFYIEVLLLQAQLLITRNQPAPATSLLEQAVILAQREQLVRMLLNADPALDTAFARLKLDGESGAFLRQILQLRRTQGRASHHPDAAPQAAATPTYEQPHHPDLIELLTNREMEVLQLLALRLTNKEIANALNISTGTVKQHTMSVFRKLHVENRREAIVQAQEMGFRLRTLQ